MGGTRNWFALVKKKLTKTSHRDIRITHSSRNLGDKSSIKEAAVGKYANLASSSSSSSSAPAPAPSLRQQENREDVAATRIQALFRGHLARRAYRALKSLVKMQAMVRGALVRKQSQIALHCMQALVRLQVRLRTQQLLSRYGDH